MRYNSRNKKRGARSKTRSNKKRSDMKSPLMITLIVLVLFVTLVIFSIVKGPVNQEENINPESDKIYIENINIKKTIDPTINVNLAISSNDIGKCNNDEFCMNMFYFAKAVELKDCEVLNDDLAENCRDNIYFEKARNSEDKSYCSSIVSADTKSACIEELK